MGFNHEENNCKDIVVLATISKLAEQGIYHDRKRFIQEFKNQTGFSEVINLDKSIKRLIASNIIQLKHIAGCEKYYMKINYEDFPIARGEK